MPESLTIWCNLPFDEATRTARDDLLAGTQGHILHLVDHDVSSPEAMERLQQAQVIFGQPPVAALTTHRALRWLEVSSAGYDPYAETDVRGVFEVLGAQLTNAGSVYADACAQHVLAMMLAACRRLPEALAAQRSKAWAFGDIRGEARVLSDSNVLLLGWGHIARRLTRLLEPFGTRLTVVRRVVTGDEGIRAVSREALLSELPPVDHLVNLLPGGRDTLHVVNADVLSRLRPSAWLYNIGRGSTLDQQALLVALERGRLAGAWLDVTDPEPLPLEHPLWRAPRCHITPHIAGGQAEERQRLVQHFLDNLTRFIDQRPLLDRVW